MIFQSYAFLPKSEASAPVFLRRAAMRVSGPDTPSASASRTCRPDSPAMRTASGSCMPRIFCLSLSDGRRSARHPKTPATHEKTASAARFRTALPVIARPRKQNNDRRRRQPRRDLPVRVRTIRGIHGTLHRRRHFRRGLAAVRQPGIPPRRAGKGEGALPDDAAVPGRNGGQDLPLGRRGGSQRGAQGEEEPDLGRHQRFPFRHVRVHRVLQGNRRRALPRGEPLHRIARRGGQLGRILQRNGKHILCQPQAFARIPGAFRREVLGAGKRGGGRTRRGTPSGPPEIRGGRVAFHQTDETDGPVHQTHRQRRRGRHALERNGSGRPGRSRGLHLLPQLREHGGGKALLPVPEDQGGGQGARRPGRLHPGELPGLR